MRYGTGWVVVACLLIGGLGGFCAGYTWRDSGRQLLIVEPAAQVQ